jgi:hypothetical protein
MATLEGQSQFPLDADLVRLVERLDVWPGNILRVEKADEMIVYPLHPAFPLSLLTPSGNIMRKLDILPTPSIGETLFPCPAWHILRI